MADNSPAVVDDRASASEGAQKKALNGSDADNMGAGQEASPRLVNGDTPTTSEHSCKVTDRALNGDNKTVECEKKTSSTKMTMKKALTLYEDDGETCEKKLNFEGATPEVGGRAKWLERQREREVKNKKLSRLKDGSYFSYLFLEKIFRESRKCKLCGAKDSGKPQTDDESSLELYVSEKGICGRQRLLCSACGGVVPVISCDTEAEMVDKLEFRIDGSTIRLYCKKIMHWHILHDLMELLHIAALDSDESRKQRHMNIAEFILHNAHKVCREWCRPESSELRSKKFLRLREESLLICHKPVFMAEHNDEYKEMYRMMAGSFRQHREKVKLILELLKTTLFDNPSPSSFMLWVSIAMMHTECYKQFKSLYGAKSFTEVDSTEYQAFKDRYFTLRCALGVKKIPVVFILFELARFYHYVEFLKERVGKERPTTFLTEEDRRTLEKFDRQAHKYVMKRRMKSGKVVSVESHLNMLMQQEELDREIINRNTSEKQKTKQEDRKRQRKLRKERLALEGPERFGIEDERVSSGGSVVQEISRGLDDLERKQRARLLYPPFRQRVMGPERERTSLETDMVADMTLRKPYKSRFELLLEEEDRQWGMEGNWSRKDVLLIEDDMMFERKVCIRFKKPNESYLDTIPSTIHLLHGNRIPTQEEVLDLFDKLLEEEIDPASFDGACDKIFQIRKRKEDVNKSTKNSLKDGEKVEAEGNEGVEREAEGTEKKEEGVAREAEGTEKKEEGVEREAEGTKKKEEVTEKKAEGVEREAEGTEKKEEGTEKKEEGVEREAEGTEKKEEGTEKKEEGVEREAEGTEKKEEGTEKKAEGVEREAEGTEKKEEGTEKKAEGVEREAEGTEKKEEGTEKKAEGVEREAEGTEKKEEGTEKKAEGVEREAEGTEKKEEGTEKKAEGVEREAEGTEKKEEGTEKKAEGVEREAEGTEKKEEGTEKKAEGVEREAEGTEKKEEGVEREAKEVEGEAEVVESGENIESNDHKSGRDKPTAVKGTEMVGGEGSRVEGETAKPEVTESVETGGENVDELDITIERDCETEYREKEVAEDTEDVNSSNSSSEDKLESENSSKIEVKPHITDVIVPDSRERLVVEEGENETECEGTVDSDSCELGEEREVRRSGAVEKPDNVPSEMDDALCSEDEEGDEDDTGVLLQQELERVLREVDWSGDPAMKASLERVVKCNYFAGAGGPLRESARTLLEALKNTKTASELPIHRFTVDPNRPPPPPDKPRIELSLEDRQLAESIADVCTDYLKNMMGYDTAISGDATEKPSHAVVSHVSENLTVTIVASEHTQLPANFVTQGQPSTLPASSTAPAPECPPTQQEETTSPTVAAKMETNIRAEKLNGDGVSDASIASADKHTDSNTHASPTVDGAVKSPSEDLTAGKREAIDDPKPTPKDEERVEPRNEKKLSKKKNKKIEKKARQLVEAVQRRKAVEERYWQKRMLRRTSSEEAFDKLMENKDRTLAELSPEEKRVLYDHCHRRRPEPYDLDQKMMPPGFKGQGSEVMRSRLRQKLYDRRMEDYGPPSRYRDKREHREETRGEESKVEGPSKPKHKSKCQSKVEAAKTVEEKLTNKDSELPSPAENLESGEKEQKNGELSMPKTEPMKSKVSDTSNLDSKPSDPDVQPEATPPTTDPEAISEVKPSLNSSLQHKSLEMTNLSNLDSKPSDPDVQPEATPPTTDPEAISEVKPSSNSSLQHKSLEMTNLSKVPPITMAKQLSQPPERRVMSAGQFRTLLVDHLKANEEAENEVPLDETTPKIRATIAERLHGKQPDPTISLPPPTPTDAPPLKLTKKQRKEAKKLLRKQNMQLMVAQVDTHLLREQGFKVNNDSTTTTVICNKEGGIEQVLEGVETPEQISELLGGRYNLVSKGTGYMSVPGDDYDGPVDEEEDDDIETKSYDAVKPKLDTVVSSMWEIEDNSGEPGEKNKLSGFPLTSRWKKDKRDKFKKVLMKGLGKAIPIEQPPEQRKMSPPKDELMELEEVGAEEREAMLVEEKEAERRERKRCRKQEKRRVDKLKREEEEKHFEEKQCLEANIEHSAAQESDSVNPLGKAEVSFSDGTMVRYNRRKPENPPINPEVYTEQTLEAIAVTPVMLTNAPSYITLEDMEDFELYPEKDNTSPGYFVYKVSVENGGKDHPFRDIYQFAHKRREELDVLVELSEISCGRNHEDALCLAGKPGRVSYSCKLHISELQTPYG